MDGKGENGSLIVLVSGLGGIVRGVLPTVCGGKNSSSFFPECKMSDPEDSLTEQVRALYREPAIGSSYSNTYGEENIRTLVDKFRSLDEAGMSRMLQLVVDFSKSPDLASSFISVAVLHALGREEEVEEAYRLAKTRDDAPNFLSHFDIGKSLADHFSAR